MNFVEMIQKDIRPDETDWQHFLQDCHRRYPQMTPEAMSFLKSPQGLNTYQEFSRLIATSLPPQADSLKTSPCSRVILDLACGDGSLTSELLPLIDRKDRVIGIDMSEAELAVAMKKLFDNKNVSLVKSQAQELPILSNSVDVVGCHMALMLMSSFSKVIHELSRVLKSNGYFLAFIDNPDQTDPIVLEILEHRKKILGTNFAYLKKYSFMEARLYDEYEWQKLFPIHDWSNHERKELIFTCPATQENYWNYFKNIYYNSFLSEAEIETWKRTLFTLVEKSTEEPRDLQLKFTLLKLRKKTL
jgi:ubiquinone/menaquinone biosynthesis C-methylase UbiE